MYAGSHAYASNQYNTVAVDSGVASADAHGLIRMLMAGAIERAGAARVALINKDAELAGRKIGATAAIVSELRGCLDHTNGGPIATQLDALYDYALRRLMHANRHRDQDALLEVMDLMSQLHSAWVDMQ
ncbi:flagellar protein [Oceanococcus atlanticus]|uniref:Flagellar secretion chaperone FliS n=1 Tax=Oceanococcus atlanticus TaxID=1317117 RepID=A0A1Y1SG61_9GAMM|nr:flagellar export chaperone FliS [Oceanococcus atlanticus]ORE88643.1 flagellar protein [Oceanococcus atlanticus]RZO84194.1 MAG: flagellar export chaperone FliS [Oceanococcus sp.]